MVTVSRSPRAERTAATLAAPLALLPAEPVRDLLPDLRLVLNYAAQIRDERAQRDYVRAESAGEEASAWQDLKERHITVCRECRYTQANTSKHGCRVWRELQWHLGQSENQFRRAVKRLERGR